MKTKLKSLITASLLTLAAPSIAATPAECGLLKGFKLNAPKVKSENGLKICESSEKEELNAMKYKVTFYPDRTPDAVLTMTYTGVFEKAMLENFKKTARKMMDSYGVVYKYQQPILIALTGGGGKNIVSDFNVINYSNVFVEEGKSKVTLQLSGLHNDPDTRKVEVIQKKNEYGQKTE